MRARSLGPAGLVAGLLPLLLAAACDSATVTDDVATGRPSLPGSLHTPYVPGLSVTFTVKARDRGRTRDWTASSSDNRVFQIDLVEPCDSGCLTVHAVTIAPGRAELVVTDEDGERVTSREIEVALPDGLRLYPAPEIFQRGSFDAVAPLNLDEEIPLVRGGMATFLVVYLRGEGFEVNGRDVRVATGDVGAVANGATSTLMPSHDWLQVTVEDTEVHEIDLVTGGLVARTVRVRGVEAEEVARLELDGELDWFESEGERIDVVARGFDDAGHRVFGLDLAWQVDGAPLTGTGDFVSYTKASGRRRLSASTGSVSVETSLPLSSVMVRSSNDLPQPTACACVVAGTRVPAVAGLLAMVALGLVGRRPPRARRRR